MFGDLLVFAFTSSNLLYLLCKGLVLSLVFKIIKRNGKYIFSIFYKFILRGLWFFFLIIWNILSPFFLTLEIVCYFFCSTYMLESFILFNLKTILYYFRFQEFLALCIECWLASFTPLWCHCIISNEKAVVNFIFPSCVWHVFFPDCFWQVWLLEHWDSWVCYTLYLSCLLLGKTLESFTWSFSSNLKTDCLSNIFLLWYWAQCVCNSSYVFVWRSYTALHAVCLLTHCLLNDKFSCYPLIHHHCLSTHLFTAIKNIGIKLEINNKRNLRKHMTFKDWIERFCINTGSMKDSDKKRLTQPIRSSMV